MVEFLWMGLHYFAKIVNSVTEMIWDSKLKNQQCDNNKLTYIDSKGRNRRKDNDGLCLSHIDSNGDKVLIDNRTQEIIINNSEESRKMSDLKSKKDAINMGDKVYRINIPTKYKKTDFEKYNCHFFRDINNDEIIIESRMKYPICDIYISPNSGELKLYWKNIEDKNYSKYLKEKINKDTNFYYSKIKSDGVKKTIIIYSKI